MRTIKFRAWDRDSKSMYWLDSETYMDKLIETESWKPMQFTGLLNKNGKEIYEGDVVSAVPVSGWVEHVGFKGEDRDLWLVRWDFDGYCWECLGKDKRYVSEQNIREGGLHFEQYKHEGFLLEEKEVIGNIYENPELLTDTK